MRKSFSLFLNLKISTIKDDKFYMANVLPLRKSSLRKMIQNGHNNRDISLTVLAKLKPIVLTDCVNRRDNHGDLKVNSKK